MAHPPTRKLAGQASQRDRDCHRLGGGPAWAANGADHQHCLEKDTQQRLVGI